MQEQKQTLTDNIETNTSTFRDSKPLCGDSSNGAWSKRRLFSKILKISAKSLGIVLIVFYVLIALLNSSVVQSFTASKAADFFAKKWGTVVKIGALNISPFITVGLKDIYVEDLQKDTLVSISYLEGNLSKIDSFKHIIIKNVKLEDVVFNMDLTEKGLNFSFIIDSFKSKEKKKKKEKPSSGPFILEVKDLSLQNINFRMRNLKNHNPIEKGKFASNRIEVKNMDLKAKDFMLKGSDISLNAKYIRLKERCGVNLRELSGLIKVSGKGISIHKGIIRTDNSFLDMDVDMVTTSFKTYSSFMDSVRIDLDMRQGSYGGLKDATYFADIMHGASQKVFFSTEAHGTLANMNIRDLTLRSNATSLRVYGRVKGLPNIDNTYCDLTIADLNSSSLDVLSQKGGAVMERIKIPDIVSRFGNVSLNGTFEGGISDFKSVLHVSTDLGAADVNAFAQSVQGGKAVCYKADITSPGLDVGTFLHNNTMGSASIEAKAEISLDKAGNKNGSLNAKVHNFSFMGNSYDEVSVEGKIDNYDIDAGVWVKDKYAYVNSNVTLNYRDNIEIGLDAVLTAVDLHRLNLYSFADTNTIVSADISAQIRNLDLDNLDGALDIRHLYVVNTDKEVSVDNLSLNVLEQEGQSKIVLNSDIADADFEGAYTVSSLKKDISYIVDKYLPDYAPMISDREEKLVEKTNLEQEHSLLSDLNFKLSVKDVSLLRDVFNLNLFLEDKMNIEGRLNKDDIVYTKVDLPDMVFAGRKVGKGEIVLNHSGDKDNDLFLTLRSSIVNLTDSLAMKDLAIGLGLAHKKAKLLAKFTEANHENTQGRIEFDCFFTDKGMQGSFADSYFTIAGKKIEFNNNHSINIFHKDVSVLNFSVSSGESKITLNGVVADKGSLTCHFSNVDLSMANAFINNPNMLLYGVINKDIVLMNIKQNPTFTSDLEIEDCAFNDTKIGKAWLKVDNSIYPDIFNANIRFLHKIGDNQYVPLQLVGTIAPSSQQDQLNLNINMQKLDLSAIEGFVSEFTSDVKGYLSCENLKVKGRFTSPEIVGGLHFDNASMKINVLGTRYSFTDDIHVDKNTISLDNFVLKDSKGNKIRIDGTASHNNFSSFDFNIKAVADKIKILDTKEDNGQMYYGTAYASATVFIKGDSTMIDVSGTAKTEAGTSLTVPVSSKESIDENNFISFVSNSDQNTSNVGDKASNKQEKSMAYNVSIDLNVNPKAKLYIPMDFNQIKGDLSAAGNGDLKIEMNSSGKFSMIGSVAIDNGKFKFNIMDVMEKNFDLQQGGSLVWNGEPANGTLDVTAVYETKTSLSSILGAAYSKPVDVQSIIHITGQMTNPKPSFDVQLPNVDEQTRDQVFMNIDRSDDKVMLEQTASILLTNQLYYSQGNSQTDALQNGVTSSVVGMAFSQLSGIVSNMVGFVDVGLNYTSSNQASGGGQMDIDISKSFGKWDLSVNTVFGSDGTTNKTSETTNIIGDMSAKYKYTDNMQIELFNHSNANDFTKYNISPYTQGIKIIGKKDYDSLKDIFIRKKKKKKNTSPDSTTTKRVKQTNNINK